MRLATCRHTTQRSRVTSAQYNLSSVYACDQTWCLGAEPGPQHRRDVGGGADVELHGMSGTQKCRCSRQSQSTSLTAVPTLPASNRGVPCGSTLRFDAASCNAPFAGQIRAALPNSSHEYVEWILTYASEEYLELPAKHEHLIDTLGPAQPYGADWPRCRNIRLISTSPSMLEASL